MQDPLRHEALVYSGHGDFVSSSVSVLRDGLDRDERLIFLASQVKVDDVRDALGSDATDITMVATDEHGRNPSRITTMLDSFRGGAADGRRALGVNETVVAARTSRAMVEAQFAESVLNAPALQAWAMSVICLYDSSELDKSYLHEMRRSHPVIRGESAENSDYESQLLDEMYGATLDPPPGHAATMDIIGPQLVSMRDFVRDHAGGFGIAPDRVDDLVLAANEIGANSIRHAGGRCTVRIWFDDNAAVFEVIDRGHIADPLLGRFAPPSTATSGRGLWLVNHLCDLVQIRSSDAGTVVRLYVDR